MTDPFYSAIDRAAAEAPIHGLDPVSTKPVGRSPSPPTESAAERAARILEEQKARAAHARQIQASRRSSSAPKRPPGRPRKDESTTLVERNGKIGGSVVGDTLIEARERCSWIMGYWKEKGYEVSAWPEPVHANAPGAKRYVVRTNMKNGAPAQYIRDESRRIAEARKHRLNARPW